MPLLTCSIPARRPDVRAVLLAVLVVTSLLAVTDSPASDRDTPAYRIYVDPVTGRYSTKSPDQQATAAPQDKSTPPAAVSVAGSSANNGTLRRPLTAALLLVAIAAASLLATVKQSP